MSQYRTNYDYPSFNQMFPEYRQIDGPFLTKLVCRVFINSFRSVKRYEQIQWPETFSRRIGKLIDLFPEDDHLFPRRYILLKHQIKKGVPNPIGIHKYMEREDILALIRDRDILDELAGINRAEDAKQARKNSDESENEIQDLVPNSFVFPKTSLLKKLIHKASRFFTIFH